MADNTGMDTTSVVEFGEFVEAEMVGMEPARCPNCTNISYESYDEYDHCGAYCAQKGLNITCWGCRESQPNQMAHVDPGGCLYAPIILPYQVTVATATVATATASKDETKDTVATAAKDNALAR